MAEVGRVIVDVVLAGAGAIVGFVASGFNPVGAIIGAGVGLKIGEQLNADANKENYTGLDESKPGGTTGIETTPGVEGNTPGSTGPQVIPRESDIAIEQAGIRNLQTKQFISEGGNTILGMKGQERQGVGALRVSAAKRYVDIKNSPLFDVETKRAESERQIALAGESLTSSVDIQRRTSGTAWNSFLLGGAKELNDQAEKSQAAWMGIFTDIVNIGSTMLKNYWDPNIAPTSVVSASAEDRYANLWKDNPWGS